MDLQKLGGTPNPAFLSQILRGKPDLSLEQGIQAVDYFQLNKQESEYFMLALQLGRSGSSKLSAFFKKKMDDLKEENSRVDRKIGEFETIDNNSRYVFYSSWKYALVHVLISIPINNQVQFLIEKTGLSEKELINVLEFLRVSGLAVKISGKWKPTKKRIHLSPEDSLVSLHHKNFRALAEKEFESYKRDSLHFSSAIALSSEDAAKIKTIFINAIAKAEIVLKPSPEETVRILCVDFFDPGVA